MTEQTTAKPYNTQKLPGDPIILVSLFKDYNIVQDLPKSGAEGIALLDEQTTPVFYVIDIRELQLDVNDVIDGANLASGSEGALYRHPMIREALFVTEQEIVAMGVKGLDSVPFGNVKARVFKTVEDALAYARANA